MAAASRALVVLLVALALQVAAPHRAVAQVPAPSCPAEVAGLPLSVSVPFSGIVRPEADDGGEVVRVRLLCAYGEGLEASAEVRLTWDPRPSAACADVDVRVADGLAEGAFTSVAATLADALGGPCPPADGSAWPPMAAAVAAGLGLVGVLALARRRPRARGVRSGTAPQRADGVAETPADERPADLVPGSDAADDRVPDVGPVLAELGAPGASGFTGSDTGQLAAIAALAYRSGDRATGDAAVEEVRRRRRTRRPARGDLVGVAQGLASREPGDGR